MFPEASHPLITDLEHLSDSELLTLWQNHTEQGRYFVTLYCRYGPLVAALLAPQSTNPPGFLQIWRQAFLELPAHTFGPTQPAPFDSLKSWFIAQTNLLPPEGLMPTSAPIPLICFLEQTLHTFNPRQRFLFLMTHYFGWSETRLTAYLQTEGEFLTRNTIAQENTQLTRSLQKSLPTDICQLYELS
ncbi:MAG: hypothetical protein AAGG02_11760 [Cyanobacteria bacterium P01_H01_bin.15]